jgi:hypothetical protein
LILRTKKNLATPIWTRDCHIPVKKVVKVEGFLEKGLRGEEKNRKNPQIFLSE